MLRSKHMTNETYQVPVQSLSTICIQLLIKIGVPKDQASIITQAVIEADLRGIDSHGVLRLPSYIQRVRAGTMTANTEMKTIRERGATLLVDAQHGFGQIAGVHAMNLAVERAAKFGVATVAIRNAGHFGIAAYYAMLALSHQMIGMVIANSAACMAPWGGTLPLLGTNPICVAIPTGEEIDIVLDMASSMAARGKIRLAEKKGISIPFGWALDPDGQPTQDPSLAMKGTLLPIGGPKGYGLALIVDILSGVMTGSDYGSHVPSTQDMDKKVTAGFLFQVIDISAFVERNQFIQDIQSLISDIRNSPKSKDVERIYLPGEIEWLNKQKRLAQGIPIPVNLQTEINDLAAELKVNARL
jgi:LDH2 family malate/lactate/ureidoglycolate dehydrogenase